MAADVTVERVARTARDLTTVLWETQAVAMAAAASACTGLDPDIGRYLFTHATRAHFAQNITSSPLPGGWSVAVDPRRMCKTILSGSDVLVRYLKENRNGHPGGVPGAGHTKASRDFWKQGSLLDDDLTTSEVTNLLLLWDYATPSDNGFTLRLVHPTGTGGYGVRTPVDVVLDLTPGPSLEQNLIFREDEADADLFALIDAVELEQHHGS